MRMRVRNWGESLGLLGLLGLGLSTCSIVCPNTSPFSFESSYRRQENSKKLAGCAITALDLVLPVVNVLSYCLVFV